MNIERTEIIQPLGFEKRGSTLLTFHKSELVISRPRHCCVIKNQLALALNHCRETKVGPQQPKQTLLALRALLWKKVGFSNAMLSLSSCIIYKCGFVNSLSVTSFPSEVNPTERAQGRERGREREWEREKIQKPEYYQSLNLHTFTHRGLHVKIRER